MNIKTFLFSILIILPSTIIEVISQPLAPVGKMWIKVEELSDEFETFDNSKWQKGPISWIGRHPGKFYPEQVFVENGKLGIRAVKQDDNYWIKTGYVASRKKMKYPLYYECSMKAAELSMASSFWMKLGDNGNNTEIDVTETYGDPSKNTDWYNNDIPYVMRTNTHDFRSGNDDTPKNFSTKNLPDGNPKKGKLMHETYHTLGCWWKDSRNISFYLDGVYQGDAKTYGPFEENLSVIFDMEPFQWPGWPTDASLADNSKNTMWVEYVHTYKLLDDDGVEIPVTGVSIDPTVVLMTRMTPEIQVNALFEPSNAKNRKVTWTTSDSTVATVNNGLIKSIGAGKATISLITEDGGFKGECEVSVDTSEIKQTAYPAGIPHAIPGDILSVHFDLGGEGISYHDSEGNQGDGIRPDEDVDTEYRITEGSVGWMANDEWMEYTVDVDEDTLYDISVLVASEKAEGKFHIEFDDVDKTGIQSVPKTGDWGAFVSHTIKGVDLSSGKKVMKFYVDTGGFNLATMSFVKSGTSQADTTSNVRFEKIELNNNMDNGIGVYPNPFYDQIRIKIASSDLYRKIQLIDMFGRVIDQISVEGRNEILLDYSSSVPKGMYLLYFVGNQSISVEKILKKQ